jgi:hypothetical protein
MFEIRVAATLLAPFHGQLRRQEHHHGQRSLGLQRFAVAHFSCVVTFPAELDEVGRSDNLTSQTRQVNQTTLSRFQTGCGHLRPRPK